MGHENRIDFLDGLRGVAIALVAAYHAFARWPEVVPYGNAYAGFPVARYGYLGVELFFLISGFVILMTLERTPSLGSFIFKRWLRLFPAMLTCSALVFATSGLLSSRPAGTPSVMALVPGLTFVDNRILTSLAGREFPLLEGAFWSLFVEVKFYIVFGTLFYVAGLRGALVGLAGLFALCWITAVYHGAFASHEIDDFVRLLTSAEHYGWFLAGALLYLHWKKPDSRWVALAMISIGLSAWLIRERGAWDSVCAALVGGLFVSCILSARMGQLFSGRLMRGVGAVSYPFYLLHENAIVALIVLLHGIAPWIPGFLLPLGPAALLLMLSWLVVQKAEPFIRQAVSGSLFLAPPAASRSQ